MDFENVIEELSVAVEGVNATLAKDFASTAKLAVSTVRAAKKAMKAGEYDEAITKCDEGIAAVNAFKERAKEATANGEGAIVGNVIAAGARIAAAVVAIMVAAGAIKAAPGAKQFVSNKAKSAKSKIEDNDIAATAMLKGMYAADKVKGSKVGKAAANAGDHVAGARDVVGGKINSGKEKAANSKAGKFVGDKAAAVKGSKPVKFVGEHKKGVAVGAASVASLGKFVKDVKQGNNASLDAMYKVLDMCVKNLEAVKAACNDARRGTDARESAMVEEFFTGVLLGAFESVEEFGVLGALVDLGVDDLTACEMYVGDIYPELIAVESFIDEEDTEHEYDEYEE